MNVKIESFITTLLEATGNTNALSDTVLTIQNFIKSQNERYSAQIDRLKKQNEKQRAKIY